MDEIKVLSDALSYIMEFHGKTVVVKYGGNAMENPEIKEKVIKDIGLLKYVGMKPVVVHGGGPEIKNMLNKLGKESEFKMGNRVTDEETMEIVEMVLGGRVNKEIVSLLNKNGIKAVGVTGKDNNLIMAKKKYIYDEGVRVDIGSVGEVENINTEVIEGLLDMGVVPVIAPLGTDKEGSTYNINADYVAAEMAGALEAIKLILMTDIDGVYRDIEDKESLIKEMTKDEVKKLIDCGIIEGGMIPKVECCLEAIEKGVEKVHILNGTKEHSILIELFTENGIGTMFTKDEGGQDAVRYIQ